MIQNVQTKAQKNDIKHFILNSLWVKAFVLVLSINTILFFSPIYFMIADDYLINYIANGSFGFEYSSYLVHMSSLLGYPLSCLYKVFPQLNWYALMLSAIVVFSFTAIIHEVYLCLKSKLIVIMLVFLNVIFVEALFSYTCVAFLADLSGLLLLVSYGLKPCNEKRGSFAQWFGVLLVIIGYCTRKEALLPTAILVIPPLFIIALEKDRFNLQKLGSLLFCPSKLLPFVACVFLIIGFSLFNQAYYSSPEWDSFLRFTNARSSVLDFPTYDYVNNHDAIASLGLSDNDCVMLYKWQFTESDVYTVERLQALSNLARESLGISERWHSGLLQLQPFWAILLLCPMGEILVLWITRKNYTSIAASLEALLFAAMVFFLGIYPYAHSTSSHSADYHYLLYRPVVMRFT